MKKAIYSVVAVILLALVISTAGTVRADGESKIILISTHDGASIKAGVSQTITWSAENFPSDGLININLIKKVSDSPASYELVRVIAKDAPNTGSATWIPAENEIGSNLSIQVGCSSSVQFENGCVEGTDSQTFAVIKGSSNTASVWAAFITAIKNLFSF